MTICLICMRIGSSSGKLIIVSKLKQIIVWVIIYFFVRSSGCHSLARKRVKELRDKNIKLDFILAFGSNNGLDRISFTEDKSSNDLIKKERRKSDFVRVKMLNYWATVLTYKKCLNYLEYCSSHFNGLKLQIMCTKIYNDINIHYLKREVHVPNNSNNNSSLSVYLTTVLSLILNHSICTY